MKAKSETALVRTCLDLLRHRNVFAWRNNSGAFVLGKGPSRRFFRAGLVGSADIIGVLPGGRFLAIECKVGRNKATDAQKSFLDAVTAAGGLAAVVYDVAELAELLDQASVHAATVATAGAPIGSRAGGSSDS